MKTRKFYETYWKDYGDIVCFEDFRQMLGGIGYVQAQRLLQKKTVKSFKIRGEYLIPKECVIDCVLSPHYADYRQILKAQIVYPSTSLWEDSKYGYAPHLFREKFGGYLCLLPG